MKAPAKGYLMVWASLGAVRDVGTPNEATLAARVTVGAKRATNTVSTHLTQDGEREQHIAQSGMSPVKKGNVNVTLEASECTSGMACIPSSSIETLFVPFGQVKLITPPAPRSRVGNG